MLHGYRYGFRVYGDTVILKNRGYDTAIIYITFIILIIFFIQKLYIKLNIKNSGNGKMQ